MCQLQERCTTKHTYLPPGSSHGRAGRAATDDNSLEIPNLSGNLTHWHLMKLRLGGPPFDPGLLRGDGWTGTASFAADRHALGRKRVKGSQLGYVGPRALT